MRIVISNRTLQHCGIDTYVYTLTNGLSQIPNTEVYDFTDRNLIGLGRQNGLLNKIMYFPKKYMRDEINLPAYIDKVHADIYHCTECFGVPHHIHTKTVLTLHDIIPARFTSQFSNLQRNMWIRRVRSAINLSNHIIAVSEFSKKDIIDFFHVPEDKILVVYETASRDFRIIPNQSTVDDVKLKYNITKPYFLTVGGDEKRKNNSAVKEIFQKVFKGKYQLVMLGSKKDTSETDIITPGFVPSDDMVALYNGAMMLVYVSHYEGFGLPVLEAMSCGVPVISSNSTSIPEVAGNAAILVDPNNLKEIAEAMSGLLRNPFKLREMKFKGVERTKVFTLENMVNGTYQVYENLLKENSD